MQKFKLFSAAFVVVLVLSGCGGDKKEAPKETPATAEVESKPKPGAPRVFWSEVKLHEAIRAKNPEYTGNGKFGIDPQGNVQGLELGDCNVSDISTLAGMSLMGLDLRNCPVADISVLKGMPLQQLYIENTKVSDISALAGNPALQKIYLSGTRVIDLTPLKGTQISELNLAETFVEDLTPLAGLPLRMLWLTGAPVENIAPLRTCPMESLTLHRTQVSDLSPLAGTKLQRLHIGECPVTDLSPLAGMSLTRLVFDKDKVEKGMDAIMMMRSLKEIGSKFDDEGKDLAHPAVFWGAVSKE